MNLQPLSPNFLVRVPKKEENEMREIKNGVWLHPNFVWMTRNTQCGEIVAISNKANKELPEAKEGDILLFHHFIQRSHSLNSDNKKFLATEDDDYKYYNVNSIECNGNNNNCYGVWDGERIIPHKEYVFLEKPNESEGWVVSKDKLYQRMNEIKSEVTYLAKNAHTEEMITVLRAKEKEMAQMTLSLQKKEYVPYKIAYANPLLGIPNGTIVYALNIGCMTELDFMDKTYIIAEYKYIAAI